MKRIALFLSVPFLFYLNTCAQVYNPVSWQFGSEHIRKNIFELRFTATIDSGWHMYGLAIPENGPIATSFTFKENSSVDFTGKMTSVEKPEITYDSTFEMNLELYSGKVTFTRQIKLVTGKETLVKGTVEFMACDNSRCLPPKEESFSIKLNKRHTNNNMASLFSIFLLAILGGFGATVTPCVYPIIPLTVSYFMRNTSRTKAVLSGLYFGLSIVLIYTLLGLIVGLTGVDLVRLVSSHWLPNLIFFLIFVALAFSFFGMFEIVLPSALSNKIDRQADAGGFLGPFFMALATVVISFSCTGPIVGIVLGGALRGELIRPVVGMLGFSIAFALPFTLLALFPGFLKSLPKSGGWLNAVKVFFAFIMLAFSLAFLGNIGLPFISRTIIVIVAAVIFLLLGLYLLGIFKFAHDSEVRHISVLRLLLIIASFAFAVYLFTGLNGSSLKLVEPFLPANEKALTAASILNPMNYPADSRANPVPLVCTNTPKYSDFLKFPLGLKGYFDYDEALACSKQINKPVLLDFAGHYCKNCKKMYAEVWSDPNVLHLLNSEFVLATLYTDDRTDLPQQDWVTSALDGKVKKTLGKKFNDFQISKFGTNALPLYAIVDSEGNILTGEKYYTYSSSIDKFIRFLKEGLNAYKTAEKNP